MSQKFEKYRAVPRNFCGPCLDKYSKFAYNKQTRRCERGVSGFWASREGADGASPRPVRRRWLSRSAPEQTVRGGGPSRYRGESVPIRGNSGGTAVFTIALSLLDSGRFLWGDGMIVIQTTIDRRAMTALAKMTRKTVRRGRNGPVRLVAWLVVILEAYLTFIYIRAGLEGWLVNVLLGGIMLGCILSEDLVNGAIGLKKLSPGALEVNTAFQEDSCYVCRSRDGERWWPYSEIMMVVESRDYFALLLDRKYGQIYDKRGFTWGTPEEFRELIRKKTGLKIQAVR